MSSGGRPRPRRARRSARVLRAARQREHAAVVVGIGVDVEQPRVERVGDRIDRAASRPSETFGTASSVVTRPLAAASGRGRARARRRSRASRRAITTSRWIGTETVPPMPALAPKATWTVPRIFSSSSTLPVSCARSLVPTPSSARFVPCSPCSRSSSRYRGPSPPSGVDDPAVVRPSAWPARR